MDLSFVFSKSGSQLLYFRFVPILLLFIFCFSLFEPLWYYGLKGVQTRICAGRYLEGPKRLYHCDALKVSKGFNAL